MGTVFALQSRARKVHHCTFQKAQVCCLSLKARIVSYLCIEYKYLTIRAFLSVSLNFKIADMLNVPPSTHTPRLGLPSWQIRHAAFMLFAVEKKEELKKANPAARTTEASLVLNG